MGNKCPVPSERVQHYRDLAGLSKKDLVHFWSVWGRADRKGEGTLLVADFHAWLGEKQTSFTQSVFDLVGLSRGTAHDVGARITYDDFVAAITQFCMLGERDIIRFCFFIYDLSKKGFIWEEDLHDLVQVLHGGVTSLSELNSNCRAALEAVQLDDGKLTYQGLENLSKRYPGLLFPAYKFRQQLMRSTFSETFWATRREAMANRRAAESDANELARLKTEFQYHKKRRRAFIVEVGCLRGRMRLCCAGTVRRLWGTNDAEARLPVPENARLVECREDEIVAPLAPVGVDEMGATKPAVAAVLERARAARKAQQKMLERKQQANMALSTRALQYQRDERRKHGRSSRRRVRHEHSARSKRGSGQTRRGRSKRRIVGLGGGDTGDKGAGTGRAPRRLKPLKPRVAPAPAI